jgi:putative DNA primase/helicase
MKFIPSIGKWIRWETDHNQWRWCELGEEVEATKGLVLELMRLAYLRAAEHPGAGQKLTNEIVGLQREPRIRAVLKLAKSEPGVSLKSGELDSHPELLGVQNGVVDLRTGCLRLNKPALYITKYVDIEYWKSATCPLFKSFLNEIFQNDGDTISSVHRLAGLTLTGRADEEIIVFCVGTGANGKSIFGNIMTAIFGAHAATAPPSLLAARRTDDHGPRSDLAMLNGARLVSINELPGGMMLDETVAKQLAGREPISARFLHKEFFTFKPQFTPWVRTNHRPIIKGTDDGIWRRIAIVPFLRTFNPDEQDPKLERKLYAEQEGILAWLVEGAKLYLRSGLRHSRQMKSELNQYRGDSDLLGEFIQDHTTPEPNFEVKQSSLFSRYREWCERNHLRPTSKRALTEQLKERGFGQRKSGSERYYVGLDLELESSPFERLW